MRTKELEKHNGSLEGIVREAETFDGQVTRFRLESAKDRDNYYCFNSYGQFFWLQNGQYVEVNFSGHYPLQMVQLDDKVRAKGRNRWKMPSNIPPKLLAKVPPLPIKPFYIDVFEIRVYDGAGKKNLLHTYQAPIPLC